eukprot:TRINITY_DN15290_c0_g1_i6.p1 TRINITY_DN15290_c0_g1~~TRINITY_DN15290_c0_g1_i6.p1  ORF type:complete len:266 (-),score=44.08 TRINITY_DN15290_c0_g1_i6:103-900(-)
MSHAHDQIERWLELACDVTTGDVAVLESDEAREAHSEHQDEFDDFERVAAALAVGLTPAEPMPAECKSRILDQVYEEASTPMLKIAGKPAATPQSGGSVWKFAAVAGWAMAAVLAIVASVSLMVEASSPMDPVDARAKIIAAGASPIAWGSWDDGTVKPVCDGVTGDVVWDTDGQEGYMRFIGLPVNDPEAAQYQLWILDGRYAEPLTQRVSGGVFNANSDGEIVIPIREGMAIDDAVGFAITRERPGGVWVSDMSERVVIALKG